MKVTANGRPFAAYPVSDGLKAAGADVPISMLSLNVTEPPKGVVSLAADVDADPPVPPVGFDETGVLPHAANAATPTTAMKVIKKVCASNQGNPTEQTSR